MPFRNFNSTPLCKIWGKYQTILSLKTYFVFIVLSFLSKNIYFLILKQIYNLKYRKHLSIK